MKEFLEDNIIEYIDNEQLFQVTWNPEKNTMQLVLFNSKEIYKINSELYTEIVHYIHEESSNLGITPTINWIGFTIFRK